MFVAGQLNGFWVTAGGVTVPAATVDWDFATTQSLVDASTAYTLSHTRAAVGATYFDSSGDLATAASGVARFGYHPVSLTSLGLSVEANVNWEENYNEQVTNAANWSSSGITASLNADTFIDGTTVADKIIPTTANSTHWIDGSGKNAAGATDHANHGIFAKAVEKTACMMECTSGTNVFKMWVDLSDGSIGDTSGSATSYGVEPLQDNWYFIWAHTVGVGVVGRSTKTYVSNGTTSGDESYAGNASDGILLCGAGLHVAPRRAFGHYRGPTTSGDIDQLDDDVDMNASGWFNATEGTVLVEFFQFDWQTQWNFYLASLVNSGAPTTDYISVSLAAHNSKFIGQIKDGGSTECQIEPAHGGVGVGGYFKIAFAYKANDCQMALDGTASAVDSSVVLPSGIDTLKLGRAWNDLQRTGGYFQRVRYWDTRLTQAQLESITT